MLNYLRYLGIVLGIAACTGKPEGYVIEGTWADGNGKVVYLKKTMGDKEYETLDSAVVKDGTFYLQNELTEPGERLLVVNGTPYHFLLDEQPIQVNCTTIKKEIKGKTFENLKVDIQGSPEQQWYRIFMNAQKDEMLTMLAISFIGQEKDLSPEMRDSIGQMYLNAKAKKAAILDTLVRNHPDSYTAAIVLDQVLAKDLGVEKTEEFFNLLSSRIQASAPGVRLRETLVRMKQTLAGNPAPDFILSSPGGREIALSDFKGKYVLLDFWASWCAPCLKEVPNLKKIYAQYHPQGFEILSVSLDDKKENWTNAIEKHDLNWQQVSSLKGWKCPVVRLYNVSGIPAMFLIDKEGRIVDSGLRGEELAEKMAELYRN